MIAVEAKSLIGQKKYVQKALKSKDLEDWERKEYEAVYEEILERQKELKIRINNIQQMSEGKLIEAWDSPQAFSSKEAQSIMNKSVKSYAKILRKAQYEVIKDWMRKAKAGVIDYFDIVRALQTGDISRAHPYETEFLNKVLNKEKIIDRFRKYFGGRKSRRK